MKILLVVLGANVDYRIIVTTLLHLEIFILLIPRLRMKYKST